MFHTLSLVLNSFKVDTVDREQSIDWKRQLRGFEAIGATSELHMHGAGAKYRRRPVMLDTTTIKT